jgi:hypothetical protein
MQAQFEYRLTKDEYILGLAALTDQLGRQDDGRTRRILEQLAIVVAVLTVITFVFPDAVMGVLIAAVLLGILQGLLRERWIRGATGQSYDESVAQQHVEIADQGILTRCPLRERRWAWPAVRRIHDLEGAVVFELVGWDMIVLPDRLWNDRDARQAFLGEVRALATEAASPDRPVKTASFDRLDLLRIGAIAAGVDVLAIAVFSLPAHRGPTPPVDDAAFLATFAILLLIGIALGYFAYRVARDALPRLHDSSPSAALLLSYLLVCAVPAYMLIAYLGWV